MKDKRTIIKDKLRIIVKSEAEIVVVTVVVSNPVTDAIPRPIKANKITTTPIGIKETKDTSSKTRKHLY